MRNAFALELTRLSKERDDICLLSGDIGNRMFDEFKKSAPSRFVNCGIAEANMMSMAAGMALAGLRPFVYTITPFTTTRCLEQIKIDIDEQDLPVLLIGYSDYPSHGPTHKAVNAPALCKAFKNLKSYFPEDSQQVKDAMLEAWDSKKPAFISLKRDHNI